MEVIKIRVQLNGEAPAINQLKEIDRLVDRINKKTVDIKPKTSSAQDVVALNKNMARLNELTNDAAKRTGLWGDALSMIKFSAIAAGLAAVTASLKSALGEMKAVDTQLVNIQKVSNMAGAQLEALGNRAYATASKYGVAASEYLSAVYTFQKAGLGDSAAQMGELATKTMLVGDTTADVASKFLIAVNAAWKLGGSMETLSKIVDEADYINNNYATSLDKLSAGMPIVASTAANVGMSVEQTLAVLGTITATTQETGTKAATAWRALAMNITGELGTITDETGETIEVTEESVKSISDALKIYGNDAVKAAQATGKIINPMEGVISLAQAYRDGLLTDIELQNILMSVGGKLRTNQLTALVRDLASDTSIYYDIMSKLPEAAGTADAEIGLMLTSWDAKTKILKNSWTEFVQKSIGTDFVKGILDVSAKILDWGDNIGLVTVQVVGITTAIRTLTAAKKAKTAATNADRIATEIGAMADRGAATEVEALTAAEKANELQTNATKAAHQKWFGYLGLGVTAVIMVYQALKQFDDEQLRSAQQSYEAAKKELDADTERLKKLEELSAKYGELTESGGSVAEIQSVQDEINALLGDQYEAVDLINGAYETQRGILDGIVTDLRTATQEELVRARAAAAGTLAEMADNWLGVGRTFNPGVGMFTSGQKLAEYSSLTSDLGYLHRGGNGRNTIPTDLQGILHWYDDLSAAIERYTAAYKDTPDALGQNEIYLGLLGYQQEFRDAVESYRALAEVGNGGGAEGAAEAAEQLVELAESADKAADGINAVTRSKNALDEALKAPGEDTAFKSMAEAVKAFRDMADAGQINSRAFWNTAEFLFGPDVLKEYYGNAQALVDLFERSDLEEVFGGEGLDSFIERLREVDDAIAEVRENTDGTVTFSIKDLDGLAEAWGMTKDQVLAVIEASEAFGALDFSGGGLVDYLEYLGVEFKNGKASAEEIRRELEAIGYTEGYIEAVTEKLESMGAVDMSGTVGGVDDVTGAENDAAAAADALDSKTLANVSGQFEGLTGTAQRAEQQMLRAADAVDALDGKKASVTVTTTYNTVGAVPRGFAAGTRSAPGGLALVGDEASPDGSPRPELVSQNGRAWLAGLNGPEIVSLAPGAQVWPYGKTKAILNGTSISTSMPAYALGTLANRADSGSGNAAYTANTCSVSFSPNGGSGGPGTMTVTKGVAFIMPSARPSRGGHSFTGWARGSANGREIYQPGGRATVSASTTFYAQWSAASSGSSVSGSYTSTSTSVSGGSSGGGWGGGGGGGGSSGSSAPDPLDVLMDELQEKLTDIEFKIWLGQKTGDLSNAEIAAEYAGAMELVNTYIQKFRDKGEDDNSDYIQKLTKQWWEYSDEVTELQDDLIGQMKEAVEEQLDEAERLKAARVQAIRDEAAAESDLLAIEEKRQALENARTERTVRIYNPVTGQWEWVADARNVQAAQKAYDTEYRRQDREARIAAIEDEYDALEDEWNAILDELKDPARELSAILADAQTVGTEKNAGIIAKAIVLSNRILGSISGGLGAGADGVMYGASPYAGLNAHVAAQTNAAGGVAYYINGVEISGERAETMTVAELARSMAALSVYNNT